MKKKNLKSLSLNKTTISKLNQEQIKGGTAPSIIVLITRAWCPSDTCITTVYEGPMQPTCGNC